MGIKCELDGGEGKGLYEVDSFTVLRVLRPQDATPITIQANVWLKINDISCLNFVN